MEVYLIRWENKSKTIIVAEDLEDAVWKADALGNPYTATFKCIENGLDIIQDLILDNFKITDNVISGTLEGINCEYLDLTLSKKLDISKIKIYE